MLRNFLIIIVAVLLVILLVTYGNDFWKNNEIFTTFEQSHTDEKNNEKDESVSIWDRIFKDKPADDISKEVEVIEEKEKPDDVKNLEETTPELTEDEKLSESEELTKDGTQELDEPVEDVVDEDIPTEKIILGVVSKGDTVLELLDDYENYNRIMEFIKAAEDVFSPKKFRIGQAYTIVYDLENDKIKRFEYEIDRIKKLIIEGDEPKAWVEEIEYEKRLTLVKSNIEDNLFLAVSRIGEEPQLALRIADIFAWEINFIRDIQKNDSFSILVEKLYRDNEFKGYGRALGATFTNKGSTYDAYLYFDNKKRESFYSNKGESLKKVLLQSPLSFTRVTSGFSYNRMHPILGYSRPHLGIDYGAPTGTPVMAVGDGVVKVRGWVGGYGYQVVITHSAGFESMYSHLSRFPKNVKKGTRVRQGQTIGYVGSTGLSTGPHLDFRLKRYGKFINPNSAMSPRGEPITKNDKDAFNNWVKIVREFMDGTRALDSYTTELFTSNN